MKIWANIISGLGHPLILVFVLVILTVSMDRFSFFMEGNHAFGAFLIMSFFLLILFPLVGLGMLAGLKMISSIHMPKREDRIGPLIITLSFFIWYFINIKSNPNIPDTFKMVTLGATIAVSFGFFFNNFFKISLHTIGASSFVTSIILLIFILNKIHFDLTLPYLGSLRLSAIFVLLLGILLAGLIGVSRLYLKAHSAKEIYTGYIIGALAQIIAYRIMI